MKKASTSSKGWSSNDLILTNSVLLTWLNLMRPLFRLKRHSYSSGLSRYKMNYDECSAKMQELEQLFKRAPDTALKSMADLN